MENECLGSQHPVSKPSSETENTTFGGATRGGQ
jgi:hypothetical protein